MARRKVIDKAIDNVLLQYTVGVFNFNSAKYRITDILLDSRKNEVLEDITDYEKEVDQILKRITSGGYSSWLIK